MIVVSSEKNSQKKSCYLKKKSRNHLSPKKPSNLKKNHATFPQKILWKIKIESQYKGQKKFKKKRKNTLTTVTAVTTITTANKHILFIYFLRLFGKSNFTHLTTDVMFSGQRFAILAMFSRWASLSMSPGRVQSFLMRPNITKTRESSHGIK